MTRHVSKIELNLRNIACFREFTIDLASGEVVELTGGNGRGKTTLLNALKANVTGGNCKLPEWLITDCEDSGSIQTRIDGITVARDINAGNTASDLEVRNEHGEALKRPATVLRDIFGDGTYLNPIEIVGMRPKDRTKAVAAALNIDPRAAAQQLEAITGRAWKITTRDEIFEAIAQAHDSLYEDRRQKRQTADDAEAQALGVLSFLPAEWLDANGDIPSPVMPPALGDVYDKKRAAEVRNAERAQLSVDLAELDATIRRMENDLAGEENAITALESTTLEPLEDEAAIDEQIRVLQHQLSAMQARNRERRLAQARLDGARSSLLSRRTALNEAKDRSEAKWRRERELGPVEDVAALQHQIDQHENRMAEYRNALQVHGERSVRWQQADELREKARVAREQWEIVDRKVKALNDLPLQLLEGVALPIEGMQICGDNIFLPDGDTLRPFEAFGEADRFRFAARLAMALAPVNILLLDGVEKCDEDRRRELYRMAAEAQFIVFSTRVTRGPLQVEHLTAADFAGE